MILTPLLALGVAAVAALSVVVFVWGYSLVRTEQSVPADLGVPERGQRRKNSNEVKGPLTSVVDLVGRPFAPTLLRVIGPAQIARLRRRIYAAGRPDGMTVETYATRKAGFFIIFGCVGVLLAFRGQTFFGVLLLVGGFFWADLALHSRARARKYEIERTLPDFLDVLTVTVSAGLGFRHALSRVCESMPGPLSDEFQTALRQMEVGTSRRNAFEELRDRNSCEALSQFVTALLQAEELGAPLSQALVEIGEDMRRESAQAARRKAARTTPRVSLILTTVMVPGVMVLLLGTIFIAQRDTFSGVLG